MDFNNIMASVQGLVSLITFETFLKLLALYFFVFWIAIIIWVTKDIINRTNNILLQILSISTVLFLTPLGVVIYLLIRPSKTLLEKYYEQGNFESLDDEFHTEELEEENEICDKPELKCFSCGFTISPDFHFCPNCKISLKKECTKCHKELNAEWKICPYCGNEDELVSEEVKPKKTRKTKEKEEVIDKIEII
ncbi:MAG: zinc ribbon domain-containing protein [Candidatus Gracilibacteria bacterium]|nr:zinc ribbon domain-containing protein [Candidatus Gracilibacteria bacterium]